jgi:hypothetical protein
MGLVIIGTIGPAMGLTLDQSTAISDVGNAAVIVGGGTAVASAAAAVVVAATPAMASATGSAVVTAATSTGVVARVVASLIQLAGEAGEAVGIPVLKGLGGEAPASQAAVNTAAAQAARAAQQAARNNARIGRPTKLPVVGGAGVGGASVGDTYYPCP